MYAFIVKTATKQSPECSNSINQHPPNDDYYYYESINKGGLLAGGVGPTIMETSYLLAGTPVIAYADGKQVNAKPVSQPLTIDFGKGLGRKTVWLYNLPEVESAFKYMKVPNVSARFGTDPGKQCAPCIACQFRCWRNTP